VKERDDRDPPEEEKNNGYGHGVKRLSEQDFASTCSVMD
jgi:hypothetical protein